MLGGLSVGLDVPARDRFLSPAKLKVILPALKRKRIHRAIIEEKKPPKADILLGQLGFASDDVPRFETALNGVRHLPSKRAKIDAAARFLVGVISEPSLQMSSIITERPTIEKKRLPVVKSKKARQRQCLRDRLRMELDDAEKKERALDEKVLTSARWAAANCDATTRTTELSRRWAVDRLVATLQRNCQRRLWNATIKWRNMAILRRNAGLVRKFLIFKVAQNAIFRWLDLVRQRQSFSFRKWIKVRDLARRCEHDKAATRLQSRGRIAVAKSRYKKAKGAVTIQTAARRAIAVMRIAGKRCQKKEDAASLKLTKFVKASLERRPAVEEKKRRRDQKRAAVAIQAKHRQKKAAQEVSARRRALDYDRQRQASAVAIQKISRARKARGLVEETKGRRSAAATALQKRHRGAAARDAIHRRRQDDAATRVSRYVRGRQGRRRVVELRRHNSAALRVQALSRGRLQREDLARRRRSACKVQAQARGRSVRIADRRNVATLKLQSRTRGYLARKARRIELFDHSVKVIQTLFVRPLMATRRVARRRQDLVEQQRSAAALKIQLAQRRKAAEATVLDRRKRRAEAEATWTLAATTASLVLQEVPHRIASEMENALRRVQHQIFNDVTAAAMETALSTAAIALNDALVASEASLIHDLTTALTARAIQTAMDLSAKTEAVSFSRAQNTAATKVQTTTRGRIERGRFRQKVLDREAAEEAIAAAIQRQEAVQAADRKAAEEAVADAIQRLEEAHSAEIDRKAVEEAVAEALRRQDEAIAIDRKAAEDVVAEALAIQREAIARAIALDRRKAEDAVADAMPVVREVSARRLQSFGRSSVARRKYLERKAERIAAMSALQASVDDGLRDAQNQRDAIARQIRASLGEYDDDDPPNDAVSDEQRYDDGPQTSNDAVSNETANEPSCDCPPSSALEESPDAPADVALEEEPSPDPPEDADVVPAATTASFPEPLSDAKAEVDQPDPEDAVDAEKSARHTTSAGYSRAMPDMVNDQKTEMHSTSAGRAMMDDDERTESRHTTSHEVMMEAKLALIESRVQDLQDRESRVTEMEERLAQENDRQLSRVHEMEERLAKENDRQLEEREKRFQALEATLAKRTADDEEALKDRFQALEASLIAKKVEEQRDLDERETRLQALEATIAERLAKVEEDPATKEVVARVETTLRDRVSELTEHSRALEAKIERLTSLAVVQQPSAEITVPNNSVVASSDGGQDDDWVAYYDDTTASTYYFNATTNETSWDLPPGVQARRGDDLLLGSSLLSPTSDAVTYEDLDSPKPVDGSPWLEYWDDEAGARYWYNTRTGEASWEKPASLSRTPSRTSHHEPRVPDILVETTSVPDDDGGCLDPPTGPEWSAIIDPISGRESWIHDHTGELWRGGSQE